jgi:type VI secretion system protein VasG
MAKLKRQDMFSKLDKAAWKALESATVLCKARGNPYVELAHWLNQIVLAGNTDFTAAAHYFALDETALTRDLVRAMGGLPNGASAIADFGDEVDMAIKEAWMVASLVFRQGAIRTGHLLIALKQTPALTRTLHDISGEFVKVNGDLLEDRFEEITADSAETNTATVATAAVAAATGQAAAIMEGAGDDNATALARYTVDMTAEATAGHTDPIVGRDKEIRRMIDILLRRRQNNPIITGDTGVGKTAVVEGFAARLALGDVPPALKGTRLLSLDMGLLKAGASMKGEFENRLKQVLGAVQSSSTPIILFIDEAHTLIAGSGASGNDAANILKPALARGKLRCIAATTYQEYSMYFEKDPALSRRFQNILVEEPDDDAAVAMMRATAGAFEAHHHVEILDEALVAAVRLSRRYLPARQLPDKALSVLDTAAAHVALSQGAEPAELEYARREREALDVRECILRREEAEGLDHADELSRLEAEREESTATLERLEERLEKERAIASDIAACRASLVAAADAPASAESDAPVSAEAGTQDTPEVLRGKLQAAREALREAQGDDPLVLPAVDGAAVAQVISEWTGIPAGRMAVSEIRTVLGLADALSGRVIGQRQGIDLIAKRVLTARASLADPEKPVAVIMLAGPSGVGKTETALALAEQIYGSDEQVVTINMSEFQEAHTVSTLKGAPPGYVGYGEGGVLTEAVRRKPYSVVLLDEVEKAHKDVHEIFFQVFDKGRMEDGQGRRINFRNTIILLTTNVGDGIIERMCQDEENLPSPAEREEAIRPAMRRVFPAALLGRLQIVPYYPLSRSVLYRIIDAKLERIAGRVRDNYHAELSLTSAVKDEIIRRCDNAASGARLIDAVVNNTLLPELSGAFLRATMDGSALKTAVIDAADGAFTYAFT